MSDPFKEIEEDYRLYYLVLKNFLSKFTQDKNLIDDIIQDVFLTLLKQPELVANITNKKAWLLACTKNKMIDHFRKKSPSLLNDVNTLELISTSNPNLQEKFIQDENINEVLALLSPENRKLFKAKYYYGFKYDEISELTGLSVSTIKLRLFRAKKMILERMNPNEY
jgi:RNA polymerase sigma-70 factor, ECF subfamily